MRKRQGRRAGTSGQEWSFLLQGHQKARLSAVLAVIVTAVNIMPAAAMSVGKPSLKKKKIEVTFQAGSGGYFEDESGSLSTGADARKASNSDIQRTKWVQSFSELEEDDEGVFTNLRLKRQRRMDRRLSGKILYIRQIKMRIRTMTLFLPGGIIPEARDRFWSATGRRFTGMLP